jgi:hypothetical protein
VERDRGRQMRLIALALSSCSMLALGAVGPPAGAAISPTERSYVDRVDALCQEALPADRRLTQQLAAVHGRDAEAARKLAPLLRRLVTNARGQVHHIRRIHPPATLAERAATWLRRAEHVIALQKRVVDAARAGDYAELERRDQATLRPAKRRDQAARQLGLQVCGGGPEASS